MFLGYPFTVVKFIGRGISKYDFELVKLPGLSRNTLLGACSDHHLDLFLGSPRFKSLAMLLNSQLTCLGGQLGFLTMPCSI